MIREEIIKDIIREVCGPDPHPEYVDHTSQEEMLLERVHGSPRSRYGAGMLYPQRTGMEELDSEQEETEDIENNDAETLESSHNTSADLSEDSASDEAVGLANEFLPSAMGFTVRFKRTQAFIKIKVNASWYDRLPSPIVERRVTAEGEIQDKINPTNSQPVQRNAWVRRPLTIPELEIPLADLYSEQGRSLEQILVQTPWDEDVQWLRLEVFNRSTNQDISNGLCTLTFSIINAVRATGNHQLDDRAILFQSGLIIKEESGKVIVPYAERMVPNDTIEEEVLRLLYRNKRSYAIGHGCSVEWDYESDSVHQISSSVIPVYEIPPVKPTSKVELSMLHLSDIGDWSIGKQSLSNLVSEYEEWIIDSEKEIDKLPETYFRAANENLKKCRANLDRIKSGVNLILNADENSELVNCFKWMNRAMIWQQQRSKTSQRLWKRRGGWRNSDYDLAAIPDNNNSHSSLEDFHSNPGNGRWRPFQIAFILMNIESIWDLNSNERDIVDLIWFPTGGGKTEAYLGLSAFAIFTRRIRGSDYQNIERHGGTAILMRYTLRLLTTQQYERASSLICGCELIRRENPELGSERISIGLWVGGSSTPNDRKGANRLYQQLTSNSYRTAEYQFIVMKCPCCGAQIGKLNEESSAQKKLIGISRTDGTNTNARIIFSCENTYCDFFNDELPLYVVDEEIYNQAPTLVLGTVDKFAMIPWRSEAGSLFGFRGTQERHRITPPELIIQDELHLISGPLGTIVGIYETLIQTLCINYQYENPPFFHGSGINAKIIASSATISRANEQVKALYSNDKLNIFPPQGLDFGNTWFSEERKPDQNNPGRKYIGVLAPGYRSGQTTVVRLYSSVLQSIKSNDSNAQDKNYYWTLLGYFNSIRELGMAASLIYADIKDYLISLQNRKLLQFVNRRRIRQLQELTSRIPSSEIPDALKEIEKDFDGNDRSAIDACIATNMIATGVDVSRLGLIIIHGQPKTTAEYIQASSRVGRDSKGPGLVIMLYSPSKPRDKSQYEHFQSFHSRIYSYVEPTSVTPFSINSRERALHAVIIGLVRHFSNTSLNRSPDLSNSLMEFDQLTEWARSIVEERCEFINEEELANTMKLFDRRVRFWRNGFQHYGDAGNYGILNNGYIPLMYSRGSETTEDIRIGGLSLPTLTSMRGVDEEGRIGILIPE